MRETSYIRMPAAEVERLCKAKLALYERLAAERVVNFAAKWRRTWRARIALFFTRRPLSDEEAAREWCDATFSYIYPWWVSDVTDLLTAADAGGEMLLSVDDYNTIQGA